MLHLWLGLVVLAMSHTCQIECTDDLLNNNDLGALTGAGSDGDGEDDGLSSQETHLWSRLSQDRNSVHRHKRDANDDEKLDGSRRHQKTEEASFLWTNENRRQARSLLAEEDAKEDHPPTFTKSYEATIQVTNLHSGEVYVVEERVLRDTVTLRMTKGSPDDDKLHICTYSKLSGFGHTIYGLECTPEVNLPARCFCTRGPTPTPYLPLRDLLEAVETKGTNSSHTDINTFKHFTTWKVHENNLELTFVFVSQHNQSTSDVPFSLRVSHNASTNSNYFSKREEKCGEIWLEYTVQRWIETTPRGRQRRDESDGEVEDADNLDDSSARSFGLSPTATGGGGVIKGDWSLAPEGVFCQRPDIYRRRLPDMPDQFSVKIETVDEAQMAVTYSEQHFDLGHKLVSFRFAPRSHSPPAVFFARFILATSFPNEVFNIVHDFHTQLQYTINDRTGNCSIQKIPRTAFDVGLETSTLNNNHEPLAMAASETSQDNTVQIDTSRTGKSRVGATNTQHIRVKHAKELLDVDPKKFVYSGQRLIRGIPADVWVAEKPSSTGGSYQTTELYFSRHDWNILVEEVNSHQELPLGMTTFTAESKNSSKFASKITSHYIEFNPTQPPWKYFDVSTCMRDSERLYLKLTLDVSYSQLVQFSLQKAHDSIRKAIAGISGVSPLRISDLHLSTSPGEKEGIDVWFVLLDSSKVVDEAYKKFQTPKRQLTINEAYRHLAKVTTQRSVPLRLQVTKDREMLAQIRRHSLQMAPESVHPSSHGRGAYRFLRASYTAGSMAGLGFSMAILGICIGIFLGFLLWKRRLGVPYHLSP